MASLFLLGRELGLQDDAEHLDREPKYARHAGRSQATPQQHHLGITRGDMRGHQRVDEEKKADHEHGIDDEAEWRGEFSERRRHGKRRD